MGQHRGGYTPFSFDITPVLAKGKNQITVKVWDPSDEGYQPRGKQVKHPDGIWYHSGQRNLANGMDGTCIRQPHHPAENDTGYR